jgi:hypothetical protein
MSLPPVTAAAKPDLRRAMQPGCLVAVLRDGSQPPILVNASDPAALEATMRKLGFGPDDYVVGRARLAHVALVEAWDRESYIDFAPR